MPRGGEELENSLECSVFEAEDLNQYMGGSSKEVQGDAPWVDSRFNIPRYTCSKSGRLEAERGVTSL